MATFSFDLSSKKIMDSGLDAYLANLPGASNADKALGMWHEFTALRGEVERLRQVSATGGAFLDTLADDEKAIVKAAFVGADGALDLAKIAAACLGVARRENTQRGKSGELGTVQARLEAVAAEMMRLNSSIAGDKWFMREAINSKSLTVAARVNIPSAQAFIDANKERVEAHNATLRNGEPVSAYFNRTAKNAAKSAEIFTAQRVRCDDSSGKWEIKIVEEAI
jgi:hypothetical protein